jgi:hypothetical protein
MPGDRPIQSPQIGRDALRRGVEAAKKPKKILEKANITLKKPDLYGQVSFLL